MVYCLNCPGVGQKNCSFLVDEHEIYQEVWNPHYPLYYNKVRKDQFWMNNSQSLEFTEAKTKTKMGSLLAVFMRENEIGKIIGTSKDKML